MNWFLLSPFSITVVNVCLLLSLLIYFLSRHPERSPATRSLLLFMSGVVVVFLSFFVIFSSVDPEVTTHGWWLLHLFVFPAVAMVQFAYHFPENLHPEESRWALPACLIPAILVYPYYVHKTLSLTPTFSFEGFLFVFLDTPEIGIVIALEILWVMGVFHRKALAFEAETRGEKVRTSEMLRPEDRRVRLIRNMMLIFLSPLVLLVALVMAYQGYLSWGLVGHILGSGLMVAAFLFAVLYINNCTEPTSFMLKLVGISLGTTLIVLGVGGSLAVGVREEAYNREQRILVEQCLEALRSGNAPTFPEEVRYILRWSEQGQEIVSANPEVVALLHELSPLPLAGDARGFRQLSPLDPRHFFLAFEGLVGTDRIEVGFDYLSYRLLLHGICRDLLLITLATVVLILAVFPAFFRLTLLRPMQALLEGVGAVNQGDRAARVPVRVRDEIGFLSESFNRMVESVQEAEISLQNSLSFQTRLTEAYSCFFPREFLDFLHKESVTDIVLGDNVQTEMTVLFSDIRSFTNLSEKMTPRENFDFLNEYLGRVGPIVRDRGGFIDKYIGDAVMALFPTSPDDAVDAALGMLAAVRKYNEELVERGREGIQIGIGLHTGTLMLGTIGEAQRMEGTVISDAVNLASRLEGLTKLYGATLLVSEATRKKLVEPERFSLRSLDLVRVKGKQETVGIHEVLDIADPISAKGKLDSREAFAAATLAYRQGRFEEAQIGFQEILAADPNDGAATLQLTRCRHYLDNGTPEDWAGITSMKEK